MTEFKINKRFFDLTIVICSFIFLSPLFLFIFILFIFFEKGPIFFKQERIGQNGKKFLIYKFRTMSLDAPNLPSSEINNIKISTIGKFLRRTNFDELPQLLNIFYGDMSIVGPRPSLPSQKDLYQLRLNNKSLSLRPGLTGLAQINSYDGMNFSKKAYYDGIYFKNKSFLLDVVIILRTIIYLFKKPPKY